MNRILRLYIEGIKLHEEQGNDAVLGKKILELLTRYHLEDRPHMFEVEFLDEPDINQRFMRFGTDPAGMREPIPIDLEKLVDLEQKN